MTPDDIRAWITTNRDIARVQLERWDGVDPTRFLTACTLLEQLLDATPASPAYTICELSPVTLIHGMLQMGMRGPEWALRMHAPAMTPGPAATNLQKQLEWCAAMGRVLRVRIEEP